MGVVTMRLNSAQDPVIRAGDYVDLVDKDNLLKYHNASVVGWSESGYLTVRLPGQKTTLELRPGGLFARKQKVADKIRRRG